MRMWTLADRQASEYCSESKEIRIAQLIYKSLSQADILPPSAFVGSGKDLAQVSIDGTFDLLAIARSVLLEL